MSKYISYKQAGVSIDAGDESAEQIYSHLASTFGPRVIESKNAFAGMFRLDYDERLFKKNYKSPVLVACTDGVGSKVQLASKIKKFDTVGIDLVAMNVNDMLVHGAEPLFFLDYLAVHKLEPVIIAQMVKGVATGCKLADCALISGETAEMPNTYKKGDFDMAGFAVGIVERTKIVAGKNIRPGDIILGLASSGLHSNGYTLARNICFKQHEMKMTDVVADLDGAVLGEVLLEPTRIYVRPIVKLLSQYNIPRVLPKNCNAVIKKNSWPKHKIFTFLQNAGPVEESEMYRVFNMGIGFVLIAAEDFANSIAKKLRRFGEQVYSIGRITTGTGQVVLK